MYQLGGTDSKQNVIEFLFIHLLVLCKFPYTLAALLSHSMLGIKNDVFGNIFSEIDRGGIYE